MPSKTYTVEVANEITGALHYRGTFESFDMAIAYRNAEANRSRKFVRYEIYAGSAGKPIQPIPGTSVNGKR